ncbi:MAG: hypothetical protein ABSA59_21020 [Terriglobia bacterium]|jgi:hypothetical protein
MITNEAEIRVALQAVLVSVLALYGLWGCALVVLVILLPWKPIFAVGSYLAQPLVDWRMQKARDRHEKGIAQIEQELDAFLRAPRGAPSASAPVPVTKTAVPAKPSHPPSPRPLESFKPNLAAGPALQDMPGTPQNLSAVLAIPPAIKNHVRNLPQGVFSNMDLEVEQVKFHGDTAEADVRFQSPNVTELVIRQHYVLRKSGDHWQVESRQPANGAGKAPPHPLPTGRPPMRLS